MIADPLALIRAAHFAVTLLASGTVFFAALVIGPTRLPQNFPILRMHMNMLVWAGLVLSILTGAMWVVWLAANILGESLADDGGAWSVLADTRFGWICCVRLVLAVLLGLLVFDPAQRVGQIIVAAAFLALPAFASHAGATPGPRGDVHVVSDAVHLVSAGGWLGGLPAFVLVLWTARRRRKPGWYDFTITVTRRFSWIAATSVAALLATGILNSWNLLDGPRDLWTTDYGRLIGFKISLLAAMVGFAAVNKFHLTPRLPARAALRNLQRNSLAEIGIGLCVLVLVGYLGRLEPTVHVHPATTIVPPDAAFTHIHAPEAMADVTINPGRAGNSAITIRVSREDFTTFAAKDVRVVLDPPAASGDSLDRDAKRQPDGTWTINDITLAPPGIWTIRVIVIAQSGETIVLDAPIVIER
ncbi:MAG TPA: copper homeostasis membrane protein CopD [Pseudolabrys sp.]|nr:copper homeostasis membrane protein CopD [Pseudolabrys sp.]